MNFVQSCNFAVHTSVPQGDGKELLDRQALMIKKEYPVRDGHGGYLVKITLVFSNN